MFHALAAASRFSPSLTAGKSELIRASASLYTGAGYSGVTTTRREAHWRRTSGNNIYIPKGLILALTTLIDDILSGSIRKRLLENTEM